MRSGVVHCLHQFPATILVSRCSFACGTDHILQLSIMILIMSHNTMQKTDLFFFKVMMIVLNHFLPLALSWLTRGCILKKVNIPAKNVRVPVKGLDLTRHP